MEKVICMMIVHYPGSVFLLTAEENVPFSYVDLVMALRKKFRIECREKGWDFRLARFEPMETRIIKFEPTVEECCKILRIQETGTGDYSCSCGADSYPSGEEK